ncbi:hypothetical protein [Mycolicibacterium hodleri]|uniref:hypothetical protein n=1 Tax=Mycolicibacterium hodleri TaxID=49897 RepID=UPI00112771A4|nr:hypothetical protein [Mycolicibacterium hodleri]
MDTPLSWMVLAASRRELAGAANLAQASAVTTKPTLVLNGYNVVATTPQNVTSFYGMFNMIPGGVGVVQGPQSFNLVDPKTGATVGSFDALVARNNSYGFGQTLVQLVVTSNDGGTVGTGAGQIPPVGSVIQSSGTALFGTIYTSMPTANGNVVSYKSYSPFGSAPLYTAFDAAKGLTDYAEVNAPIELPNGYSILPVSPSSEEFTGIAGSPPLFLSLQGRQTFKVVDQNNNVVGTFEGVVTTTSDAVDTYSEAILVTASDGPNVGTGVGQVPPVGTVYNVIYFGSPDTRVLYYAKPSDSGTVISTTYTKNGKTTPLNFITFDATKSTAKDTLTVPGRYTLTATAPFDTTTASGINGLPPREVEIQGYQQYQVKNKAGVVVGTVNAQVINQWDWSGNSKQSVLVTDIVDGNPGTGVNDVPPVGSVFNFSFNGSSNYGQAYYALPSPTGDVVAYKLVTPFGAFNLFNSYDAAAGLGNPDDYTFYNPLNVNPLNVMAAASRTPALGSSAAPVTCSNDVNALACIAV